MNKQSVSGRFLVPQYAAFEGSESSSSFDVHNTLPKKQQESTTPPAASQSPAADDSIKEETKTRRSISFNPNVRCRTIRSHKDMTESQISKTWLSRADIARFKQDCTQVLYLINADLKVEGMGERGAEHFNERRVQERGKLRKSLLNEISCMQDLQSKFCQSMHERCILSDMLAERCVQLTASSQTFAYLRAHSDAAEAGQD
jgi:hypothetical protein